MMMGTDVGSLWMLSLPRFKSSEEELTVFPRHTKVIAMVGLQGIVKKAVGLGG
jgi:hypothetical protein